MSAPDHASTSDAMPTPTVGSGSADLVTDSNDPQELHALLERARERLSFYESFDRIIGENLRRTGEMMAETVAFREQAAQAARERAEADAALQADRERYRALIEDALSEVRTAQPVIDSMVHRLQSALDELAGDSETTPPPALPAETETLARSSPEPATDQDTSSAPDIESAEEEAPAENSEPMLSANTDADEQSDVSGAAEDIPAQPTALSGPTSMDVIAHGVPSAATAIGLQQMLRKLDPVTKVEAREFADGELRLHVECSGPVPDEPVAAWLSRNSGSLVGRNTKAIEVRFS